MTSKLLYLGSILRGIKSQESVVLIFAMVRASNLKSLRDFSIRKIKRMQCKRQVSSIRPKGKRRED